MPNNQTLEFFFNCFFIMGQIKEDIAYEGISYDYSTGEVRRY